MAAVPPSAKCLTIDYSHSRSPPRCDDKAQLTLTYVHEFLRWRPHRFNMAYNSEESTQCSRSATLEMGKVSRVAQAALHGGKQDT